MWLHHHPVASLRLCSQRYLAEKGMGKSSEVMALKAKLEESIENLTVKMKGWEASENETMLKMTQAERQQELGLAHNAVGLTQMEAGADVKKLKV
jgi:hypothetical protein